MYALPSAATVYCENGWALLQQHTAGCLAANYGVVPRLNASGCGFLSDAVVRDVAALASTVKLTYFSQTAISTNANAVVALRTGATWHNGATFAGAPWCWTTDGCQGAAGWPNMYGSCNHGDCVHWVAASFHAPNVGGNPDMFSQTWVQ
jgi:hypothetical protein